ncbi:MAG TPA: trigger factor [Burkholderiales bacterium]|nr:trigger factor [Burkholderiales bacterium]
MQTSLEMLGALERRLNVSVPQGQIEAEVENRLKRLARTARVAGFRPGKVPLKIVVQQYGAQVRQEVLGETLQRSFSEAVQTQKLRVAGYPRFEPRVGESKAEGFEYSATFEIYPEVQLGDVTAATIERPVLTVGPAQVDKTIEVLRKQRVRYVPVARAALPGDQVTLDFRGTVDGVEFPGGAGQNMAVVLGEGRLLADFEKQMTGMSAGESKTFELSFPQDYHGKEVAGKTAIFEVSLKQVAGPELPSVDADFAKALGIADGDLDKMRAEVQGNLEREVRRRVQARVKEQVMQVLIETTRLDLPKALVEMEGQQLAENMKRDLEMRGVRSQGASLPAEMFREQAERRVRLGLILSELVKVNDLHARPEQVRAAVEDLAQSYEHPQEVVQWHYEAPERLRDAQALVLEDNVVAWVQARAKAVDKPVDFDEFMGKQ